MDATYPLSFQSYKSPCPRRMSIGDLDPSLAMGFLCPTEQQFDDLCDKITHVSAKPERMFTITINIHVFIFHSKPFYVNIRFNLPQSSLELRLLLCLTKCLGMLHHPWREFLEPPQSNETFKIVVGILWLIRQDAGCTGTEKIRETLADSPLPTRNLYFINFSWYISIIHI